MVHKIATKTSITLPQSPPPPSASRFTSGSLRSAPTLPHHTACVAIQRFNIISHMKPSMYRRLQALSLMSSLPPSDTINLRQPLEELVGASWLMAPQPQPMQTNTSMHLREHRQRVLWLEWKAAAEFSAARCQGGKLSCFSKGLLAITRMAYVGWWVEQLLSLSTDNTFTLP